MVKTASRVAYTATRLPEEVCHVARTAAALARRRDDAANRAPSRCPVRGCGRVRPRPGFDERHQRCSRQPDHDDELPRLDGEDHRRRLQEEDRDQRQAGQRPDRRHLRRGTAGLPEQGQLRHVARRAGARRAAEEGQPAPAGRLLEDPERQERRQALPRRVPVGPADRLRQDGLRLPQGPDLREADELGRPLDARQEVLRQGDAARLRRRHPRHGAQVQGLLDQLGQREGAERGARRPARAEAPRPGVPAHRFREAAAEGDGGDRGRLRLRHRARPAEEQEHRVGVADRGDARLPRWLARRRGDEEPARGRAVHELPARAQGVRRLRQQHRLRVRDAVGREVHRQGDREQREPQVRPRRAEDDRVREVPRRRGDQAPQHASGRRSRTARTGSDAAPSPAPYLDDARLFPYAPDPPAAARAGRHATDRAARRERDPSRTVPRRTRGGAAGDRPGAPLSRARRCCSSSGWRSATTSTRTASWSRTAPTP